MASYPYFSKSFNNKISKTVRNYQKRRTYYIKKGYSAPPSVTVKDIKNYYGDNKAAINRRLRQLDEYTQENAKEKIKVGRYNAQINKYDYERYKDNKDIALNSLYEQLAHSKLHDREHGYRNLPSERTNELKSRINTIKQGTKRSANKKEIEAAMRQVNYYTEQRIKTDAQFYDNFFEMFDYQMSMALVPKSTRNKIKRQFSRLAPDELLEMMEQEPDVKNVLMWYKVTKATKTRSLQAEIYDFEAEKMTTERDAERKRFMELADYLPTVIDRYYNKNINKRLYGNNKNSNTKYLKNLRKYIK